MRSTYKCGSISTYRQRNRRVRRYKHWQVWMNMKCGPPYDRP